MIVDGDVLRFRIRDFRHFEVSGLPMRVEGLGPLIPWMGSVGACRRLIEQGGLRVNGDSAVAGMVIDEGHFTDGVMRVSRGKTDRDVVLVLLPGVDVEGVYWEVGRDHD